MKQTLRELREMTGIVATAMGLGAREVHLIGPRVLVVLTDAGWRLTDGARFTKTYPSANAAMNDKATIDDLNFGEPVANLEIEVKRREAS